MPRAALKLRPPIASAMPETLGAKLGFLEMDHMFFCRGIQIILNSFKKINTKVLFPRLDFLNMPFRNRSLRREIVVVAPFVQARGVFRQGQQHDGGS